MSIAAKVLRLRKLVASTPQSNPTRSLSFTDAEYEKLGALAAAARLGRSEYIIEKLGLAK